MPTYTALLDDQVPLITYDSNWQAGTSADDDEASFYYAGTFTTSNVTGGHATLTFNGTGVWVYGAMRFNHGTYTVQVDDSTYSNLNGYSGTSAFQQLLFNQSGLAQGTHKLTITEADTTGHYVDIDLIVIQSEVGGSDQELVPSIIQDTDLAFSYQPSQAWSTDPPYVQLYNNGTGHSTATSSATATLKFAGDVITLYGTIGTDTGQYSAQLDSQPPVNFTSTRAMQYTQMMLFHADNLGPGEHQLTLTNLPQSATQLLNIDYAEIVTLTNGSSTTYNSVNTSGSNSKGIDSGAIAGLVVLAMSALAAACAAFWFFRKWREAEANYVDLYRSYAQKPLQPAAFTSGLLAGSSVNGTTYDLRSRDGSESRYANSPMSPPYSSESFPMTGYPSSNVISPLHASNQRGDY